MRLFRHAIVTLFPGRGGNHATRIGLADDERTTPIATGFVASERADDLPRPEEVTACPT
jgi:hypothetical protein